MAAEGVGAARSADPRRSTATAARAARWWALACATKGRCLLSMVDAGTQQRSQRDVLRRGAVLQLALACRWSATARDAAAVYQGSLALLSAVGPLDKSEVTRGQLVAPLRCAFRACIDAGDASDPRLLAAVGARAARAMLATNERHAALELLTEAFAVVPSQAQHPLWSVFVQTQAELGLDTQAALSHLQTGPPTLRAEVLLSLTRAAAVHKDRFKYFRTALEVLEGRFSRAWVLLEMAEWLGSMRTPRGKVRGLLLEAVSMFHDVFSRAEDEEDGGQQGMGMGMGMGGGGGGSVADSRARGGASMSGSSFRGSRGRPAVASGATGSIGWAGSAAASSQAPGSVAGSRASGGGASSAASSSHMGTGAAEADEKLNDWPARPGVQHAIALVRGHVGLALLAESGSELTGALIGAAQWAAAALRLTAWSCAQSQAERRFKKLPRSERAAVQNAGEWIVREAAKGCPALPEDAAGWMELAESALVAESGSVDATSSGEAGGSAGQDGRQGGTAAPSSSRESSTSRWSSAWEFLCDEPGKASRAYASFALGRAAVPDVGAVLGLLRLLRELLREAGLGQEAGPVVLLQALLAQLPGAAEGEPEDALGQLAVAGLRAWVTESAGVRGVQNASRSAAESLDLAEALSCEGEASLREDAEGAAA